MQHVEFIIQPLRRAVVIAGIGDHSPIGCEDAVQRSQHHGDGGSRSHVHQHAIEGTIQLKNVGKLPLIHPENPKAPGVREGIPGPGLEDKFRR